MTTPAPYLPAASPALSQADQDALTDLYVRGTPANTLRAYERDLLYVTAWKQVRFGAALDWPESEATALAFLLDHARDLNDAPERPNWPEAVRSDKFWNICEHHCLRSAIPSSFHIHEKS